MKDDVIEKQYRHTLVPIVRKVDSVRVFCRLLSLSSAVIFFFVYRKLIREGWDMNETYAVGLIFLGLILMCAPLVWFGGYAKRTLMPHICDFFSHVSLSYSSGLNIGADQDPQAISYFEVLMPHLFALYDYDKKEPPYLHCDDFFYGNYRGLPFAFSDYVLYYGKSKRRKVSVRGLVIAIFKEDPARQTVFLRRDGEPSIKDTQKINLEDPLFESYFDAYGIDQIEARRLLTPRMMENVVRLSALLNDEDPDDIKNLLKHLIPEVMIDSEMISIFIPKSKDLFEVKENAFFMKVSDEQVLSVLKDITLILDSIEYMVKIGLVKAEE